MALSTRLRISTESSVASPDRARVACDDLDELLLAKSKGRDLGNDLSGQRGQLDGASE